MKVLIFPRGENPYQELLYSEMRKMHAEDSFTYLNASYILTPLYPIIFIIYRLRGYQIIHIHWLPFAIYFPFPFSKKLAYIYGIACLYIMLLLRYKIVWTVHDVLPHEQHTSNDLRITQKFIDHSSYVLLLSSANKKDMAEAGVKYDKDKTVVIQHGNYESEYPNTISKQSARK